jgi:hypothetical protein
MARSLPERRRATGTTERADRLIDALTISSEITGRADSVLVQDIGDRCLKT